MKISFFLPLIALLVSLPSLPAAPENTAGPLVGSVTSSSAGLWMYAPAGSKCAVNYRPASEDSPDRRAEFAPHPNPASKGPGHTFGVVLDNLVPATSYAYSVTVNGKSDPAWNGQFTTAPVEGKPGSFRMVLTSCMKHGQPQGSWNLLAAQKPAFHLTLGDTHYADTTDPTIQLQHHVRYRRVPEFASVIRTIPTYAMWDDHDYGPNDSDGTAKGKENSLAGWRQFWANPGAGTEQTPGAFYKFTWGEVEFFVVDGRYHRSPDKHPDNAEKRMLGDAQFTWLLDGLKASQAKFKVIASGSTLHHSKGDGWRIYTFSRHRLFDALKEHGISGVMYFSGDIHNSLVWEHPESARVGYPLVEVISSGVANSRNLSFATVDFDTTPADPTARVRIVMGDGTIPTDKTWKLSQLGGKGLVEPRPE